MLSFSIRKRQVTCMTKCKCKTLPYHKDQITYLCLYILAQPAVWDNRMPWKPASTNLVSYISMKRANLTSKTKSALVSQGPNWLATVGPCWTCWAKLNPENADLGFRFAELALKRFNFALRNFNLASSVLLAPLSAKRSIVRFGPNKM